jgi:hypothetical protein
VTTAIVIKIVLPLSLLALFGILYKTFEPHPGPPHFNARQQQGINSLQTARDSGKDLK